MQQTGVGQRIFIGQFSDDSGLSYLNARYYEAGRGQFLSEDPTFLDVGKSFFANKVLSNPQSLNSYEAAIASIQSQINAIQGKINELKSSSSSNKKN